LEGFHHAGLVGEFEAASKATAGLGVLVVGRVDLRPILRRHGCLHFHSIAAIDRVDASSEVVDEVVGDWEVGIVLDEHLQYMGHGTAFDSRRSNMD
jgi:hypothetical protein